MGINDDLLLEGKADYYIIQIGIVDCYPRVLSKFLKGILKVLRILKLGLISDKVIKLTSKHSYFITKHLKKVYVKKEIFCNEYEEIIKKLKKLNPNSNIILINIATTGPKTIARRYNVLENIIEYNKEIENLRNKYDLDLIDLFKLTLNFKSYLLEDEQHISKECHFNIFREVCKIINKNENYELEI